MPDAAAEHPLEGPFITGYDVHCEGEIGRVVTHGLSDIPGDTMVERMNFMNGEGDALRAFLINEPRGSVQMSVNLMLPPVTPGSDAAFLVLQPDGCHAMSGSNAMCVATVVRRTRMAPADDSPAVVRLDTPAGLVTATSSPISKNGSRTSVVMPPSFVEHLDHPLDLEDGTRLEADIAYGGAYYALVSTERTGIPIENSQAPRLIDLAGKIFRAAQQQVPVQHPTITSLRSIEYVMFVTPFDRAARTIKGCTIIAPGRVDRSPCGTGTAARLAVMHARGDITTGDVVTQFSLIDSSFVAQVLHTTEAGARQAVVCELAGRSWIYGKHSWIRDVGDPFPQGFTVGDVWPNREDVR